MIHQKTKIPKMSLFNTPKLLLKYKKILWQNVNDFYEAFKLKEIEFMKEMTVIFRKTLFVRHNRRSVVRGGEDILETLSTGRR